MRDSDVTKFKFSNLNTGNLHPHRAYLVITRYAYNLYVRRLYDTVYYERC